jgi:hypothetical protein
MELKFVYNIIRSRVFSLLLISTLSFYNVYSQTILNRSISTGYVAYDNNNLLPYIAPKLSRFDDSLFLIEYASSDSANLQSNYNFELYTFNSLSLIDKNSVVERGAKLVPVSPNNQELGLPAGIIRDKINHESFIYEMDYSGQFRSNLRVYSVSNKIYKDSLVVSVSFNAESITAIPLINDSSIFLITTLTQSIYKIYELDFGGQILNSRTIDFNAFDLNQDFNVQNVNQIYSHHKSDTLIVLPEIRSNFLVFLSTNSLRTIQKIGITSAMSAQLANNSDFAGAFNTDFYFDSSGVYFGGYSRIIDANLNFNEQYFECKLNWDSTLVYFNSFGDTLIDEQSYGFDRSSNWNYNVGSFPINAPFYPYRSANRTCLLTRSSQNLQDSIHLFGNYNHIGYDLLVDSISSNIILLSYFSEALTTDSIYLQLTKIPTAVLTTLDELRSEEKSQNILVYPNPVEDQLFSEYFEADMDYKIFDQSGRLLKRGTIDNQRSIELRKLQKGTYILQLQKGRAFDSVVIMKQ